MANSGFGKQCAKCSNCSSTSKQDVLYVCACRRRLSPISVVEMSQESSMGSSEYEVSADRKKENQPITDSASGKVMVNIEVSISQHELTSYFLIPSLAWSMSLGPLSAKSLPS